MPRAILLALAALFAFGCWGDITYDHSRQTPFQAKSKEERELLKKLGQAPEGAAKPAEQADKAAENK